MELQQQQLLWNKQCWQQTLSTATLLATQQQSSWEQFNQQHHNATASLNEIQCQQFKCAITLSDFILSSALHSPDAVIKLFKEESFLTPTLPCYKTLLQSLLSDCDSEASLHKILRQFRLTHMVNIAVADLLYSVDLEVSLYRLSSLADELILASLHWLTTFCEKQWGTPKDAEGNTMPLLVYGMGKLGGKELNFSSDIDLIFSYPQRGETVGCRRSLDNQQFFTRLAQKLITSLHQQTADGFVYRVDMRLRPFGESGPLVITFDAMEDYYQEQGRDWERYAMLKARLIGEGEYHQQLTDMLRPFVYRRYIDFSVIDSLRRMKMMISQEVRRKQLVNNIKLGAGGIREVEFIVQVFQLIRGGRIKSLQNRRLLTVLPLLVTEGEITEKSKQVLEGAYRFLRRLENIIQALADKQTQTLPDNELDQQRIITVLNISSWPALLSELDKHMQGVHDEFELLIGLDSPNQQAEDQHWVALWLSRWDNQESIAWIENKELDEQSNVGVWKSDDVWRFISDFRESITKKSLGNRGRQVLDKLIPLILGHIHQANQSAVVLERVLIIFKKIVTRTAYLELLFENEGALKQLIHLCQASPWVADYIAKYPILLDELIDPELQRSPVKLSEYALELHENMLRVPEEDLEAQMDTLRLFKQAQQLRIAAADIANIIDVKQVSMHLTALASAIVEEVIHLAWQQITYRFGVPESLLLKTGTTDINKGFGVIAYGKMGGKELGYGSDLDLVFVHQSARNEFTVGVEKSEDSLSHSSGIEHVSNVVKSIPASQFYMKLAQRIMHIFNTRMSSGILYELDMRLRPSGNSGLLVVHINTFGQYQLEDAWTWEHQALVRARMIFGNQHINDEFTKLRQEVLTKHRDKNQLKQEVITMREKMRNHLDKSSTELFDIKQGAGGLVDIEFIAQYLVLAYSEKMPSLLEPSDNVAVFNELYQLEILLESEKSVLVESYQTLLGLGHKLTLQNDKLLVPVNVFNNNENILAIWNKYIHLD